MFQHNAVSLRFFTLVMASILLFACSSSDKDDKDTSAPSFSVQFSTTEIELAVNDTASLSYAISQSADFDIEVSLNSQAAGLHVELDTEQRLLHLQAGSHALESSLTLSFSSPNQTFEQIISVRVVTDAEEPTDPDQSECPDNGSNCPEPQPSPAYRILLPSDYITLFEGETITLDIKRNYEPDVSISEEFYFNSPLISGRVSADGHQLIITALEGESDTYGEVIAVTKAAGVEHKTSMQLLYFNKNRDLTTAQAPVIALLEPNIELTPYQSKTINFDVYDPDSDRIAYRIVSAPNWLETHINKAKAGFDLTLYPVEPPDPQDTSLVLEVSDAYNRDQFEFEINAVALSQRPSATEIPQRPRLLLEKNVSLSLLQRLTGNETEQIARLAFAYADIDSEHVELSVETSSNDVSLKLTYPFIYLFAEDVSSLQYEQVTVTAYDGHFASKMTFHLYIKNNFTEFLGGNPNLAPLIAVDSPVSVLETKSTSIEYQLSDFELHDFDAEIAFDELALHAILNDSHIQLAALAISGEDDLTSEITLTATDVFGSQRQQSITVNIEKNTPPTITFSQEGDVFDQIRLIEGTSVTFDVHVEDINEGQLTPEFSFNTNKLHVNYQNGALTLTALDIVEDFTGEFTVSATDEFGATTEASLPLEIIFTNTAPVITMDVTEVAILPGDSVELDLSYVDPEADELSINRVVDNGNLSFSYDESSSVLTLTVAAEADFEDVYHFTTTASDGFLSSEYILSVRVPDEPAPPVISVEPYFTNVNEGATFIINFTATDDNGDDINLSLTGADLAELTVALLDSDDADEVPDYVEITVPDNVLVDTNYTFNINAVDNSSSILTDVETINLTVMPVNDVPQVTLGQETVTLINDDQFTLPLSIVDPDDTSHTVEVRTSSSAIIPDDIVIHATSNNAIIISGASKGTIVNNLPLVVRVYDSEAFSDVPLTVNVELDNQPPFFDPNMVGLIQLPANSTETFNITPNDPDAASDGDVVTVLSVTVDDPSAIEIVGDPANPALNTVTFNTLNVTEDTRAFITITISDGFETVTERVQIHIP